jgi:hypothetical protein
MRTPKDDGQDPLTPRLASASASLVLAMIDDKDDKDDYHDENNNGSGKTDALTSLLATASASLVSARIASSWR